MAENLKIDNVDLKILEILMQDAKKPYTEVAKKAFVSGVQRQVEAAVQAFFEGDHGFGSFNALDLLDFIVKNHL